MRGRSTSVVLKQNQSWLRSDGKSLSMVSIESNSVEIANRVKHTKDHLLPMHAVVQGSFDNVALAHTSDVTRNEARRWKSVIGAYAKCSVSSMPRSNQIWISYSCQLNGTNEVQLNTENTQAVQRRSNGRFSRAPQIEETIKLNEWTSNGVSTDDGNRDGKKATMRAKEAKWNQTESLRKSGQKNECEQYRISSGMTSRRYVAIHCDFVQCEM